MTQWLPTLFTFLVSTASLFSPQIQGFVKNHPESSIVIGGIYAVIKGLLPSPIAGK